MPRGGSRSRLIGQSGVWAVASQLGLRGHNCLFPTVDNGYDLMIENGLKLQIKSRYLIGRDCKAYPHWMYSFDLRRSIWDSKLGRVKGFSSYSQIADFFVLWGIDENRFWIVPSSLDQSSVNIGSRLSNQNRGTQHDCRESKLRRMESMEDRWDLLDVAESTRKLIESADLPDALEETL